MYPQPADSLAANAGRLLSQVRGTNGGDTKAAEELRQAMDALIEATFSTDGWAASGGRSVEVLLGLVDQLLGDKAGRVLGDCGVRSAALVLCRVPPSMRTVCSQGGDEASACGARIVDAFLMRLVGACDAAEQRLGASLAGTADADIDTLLCGAGSCMEAAGECVEKLLPGDDGLLASQSIWKAALEGTDAIAAYLARLFECASRLFVHCTHAAVRGQKQYLALSSSLHKASGRVMDLVSAVFGSGAQLGAADLGRKRSLLERYCTYALSVHKSIMSSPPQFKATWKSVCAIATTFNEPSFSRGAMCLKVFLQSCATVRMLASQVMTALQRAGADGLSDPKQQRRIKGLLAFVRYIVFQMPSLSTRIQSSGSRAGNSEAMSSAMGMLDVLFGELAAPQLLTTLPKDVSSMVHQLVSTVSMRFAVSLFAGDIQPLLLYMDQLHQTGPNSESTQMVLIDGIRHPTANREILRTVLSGIGSFSEEQQTRLLTHAVPLPMALCMAVDCHTASVFVVTKGAERINDEQRQAATTEYERLVCSLAQCATRLATPDLFGYWERAMLLVIVQAPAGSLGAQMAVDAWGILATQQLSPNMALSTTKGILETVMAGSSRVSKAAQLLVLQLLSHLLPVCNESDLAASLSGICERALREQDAAKLAVLCVVVPWAQVSKQPPLQSIGRRMAEGSVALLGSSDFADNSALVGGIAALLADSRLASGLDIYSTIKRHLLGALGRTLAPTTTSEAQRLQGAAESAIQLAVALSEGGSADTAELLEVCLQKLDSPVLSMAGPAFELARFGGSCAAVDVSSWSGPAQASLQRVFAHLLSDSVPWVVRHQARVQVIRFATESADQAVADTLVPDHLQGPMLQHIQRNPGGESVESADAREKLYCSVFGASALWAWPSDLSMDIDEQGESGHGADASRIVDTISELRQRLEATLQDPLPAGAAGAVSSELARLVQTIERLQPDPGHVT